MTRMRLKIWQEWNRLISRVLFNLPSIWISRRRDIQATNPVRLKKAVRRTLLGLASHGVYIHPGLPAGRVSSYLAISPLPRFRGGIFSVALSLIGPLPAVALAVSQHAAL